jgi:hypothetical protein
VWHDQLTMLSLGGRNGAARGELITRLGGLAVTIAYATLVAWLFSHQPQTVAQMTGGLAATIGVYAVNETAFADGLRFFRNDQFVEARMAFGRADPALRDVRTQFYIAYSYYRQGWGRLYHDDDLYAQGLEAIDRAVALAPDRRVSIEDGDLRIHTAEELKAELEAGRRHDASDLNPMRIFRERK